MATGDRLESCPRSAYASGFDEVSPELRPRLWPQALPFAKRRDPASRCIVVCLHGFGATPFEVRAVGEACFEAGLDVVAPLLAGHGYREGDDQRLGMRHFHHQDALESVRDEVARCRELGYRHVLGFGQSMGGALTLAAAAEGLFESVAVSAPALRLPAPAHLLRLVPRWLDFNIPNERQEAFENYWYRFHPVQAVKELSVLAAHARRSLGHIRCPVLVAHSHADDVIAPAVSDWVAERVGGPVEQRWFDASGHSMTVDVCMKEVAEAAAKHLADTAPSRA